MEYILPDFNYIKFAIVPKDCNFGSLYSQGSYLQLVFETFIISLKLGIHKAVLRHKELNDFSKAAWWSFTVFLNIPQNSTNFHQISMQKCGKNAFQVGASFANTWFRDYRLKKKWK